MWLRLRLEVEIAVGVEDEDGIEVVRELEIEVWGAI